MTANPPRTSPDRDIGLLAARQHGPVARRQLRSLGVSDTTIDRRLAQGRLFAIHRGVYAVGHPRLSIRGHWMAAVLALGEGAVLSHRAAAALWGLCNPPSGRLDVTVPRRTGHTRRSDVRVHRSSTLTAKDVTVRDGIPVTTVPRTLVDLAATEPRRVIERALDEAERLRLLNLNQLQAILGENRGRRGTIPLLSLLNEHKPGSTLTRNELEEAFLTLCRHHGLPEPRVNTWIALPENTGYRPDFLWPAHSLIAEVDGGSHKTDKAFTQDRRRDRRLRLEGYETLRFTEEEVTRTPTAVAAELREHLQIS